MAEKLTVRTNQDLPQVLRALSALPGSLSLKGTPDELGLIFANTILMEMLKRIHAAFLRKSRGLPDEFGNRWQPLAPSTIRRKLSRRQSTAPSGALGSNLTPAKRRQWETTFQRSLTQFRRLGLSQPDAMSKARRAAWDRISGSGTGDKVPIGIDSGRLVSALQPGKLTGAAYLPPPHQKVSLSSGNLRVRIDLSHYARFDSQRPVTPSGSQMLRWLKDSTTIAIRRSAASMNTRPSILPQ